MKKNVLIGLMALFTIGIIGYNQYQNNVEDNSSSEIKLIDEQEDTNEIKDINEQTEKSMGDFISEIFN